MLEWLNNLFKGKRVARKPHRFVTEDIKSYIISQYESGTSRKEIALATDLSNSTICRHIRKYEREKMSQSNTQKDSYGNNNITD